MNQSVYLSTLDIKKVAMHDCWYDYNKRKYRDNAEVSYVDTNSFRAKVKTEDLYKDIARDVKKTLETSFMELLSQQTPTYLKNKKVIELIKDKIGGKIME